MAAYEHQARATPWTLTLGDCLASLVAQHDLPGQTLNLSELATTPFLVLFAPARPDRRLPAPPEPARPAGAARSCDDGFVLPPNRSGSTGIGEDLPYRITTLNQIRHLGFTAPEDLRERLKGLPRQHLATVAAALRPRAGGDPVIFATKTALSILGHRVLALDVERERLNSLLAELVEKTAPELLGVYGVGVDTAATLLVTAGDNPGRIRSEAAWTHLCGVAPIQASSGKVTRVRPSGGW